MPLQKETGSWEPRLPPSRLRAQVDAALGFLGLEPRSRILEFACGFGRHALELARRGHRVLGIGFGHPLSEARAEARAEGLNAHFLEGDMRQIPYHAEFDAVVSFSSFGRLPSERDDLKALESARKALKPGGKLLLDLLNKEWLMRHFESASRRQGQEGVSFDLESGRLEERRALLSRDWARAACASLRVYALTEIRSLLARSGLTYLRSWGGFDGSPYGMDSPRMLVLSEKPPEGGLRPRQPRDPASAIRIKGRGKSRG